MLKKHNTYINFDIKPIFRKLQDGILHKILNSFLVILTYIFLYTNSLIRFVYYVVTNNFVNQFCICYNI